jgi:hypothetical protein
MTPFLVGLISDSFVVVLAGPIPEVLCFFGKAKALGAGTQGNGIARRNGSNAATIDS